MKGAVQRKRGQTLLEYILLMSMMAVLSAAFIKFMGGELFGSGLDRLPAKTGVCVSHGQNLECK